MTYEYHSSYYSNYLYYSTYFIPNTNNYLYLFNISIT